MIWLSKSPRLRSPVKDRLNVRTDHRPNGTLELLRLSLRFGRFTIFNFWQRPLKFSCRKFSTQLTFDIRVNRYRDVIQQCFLSREKKSIYLYKEYTRLNTEKMPIGSCTVYNVNCGQPKHVCQELTAELLLFMLAPWHFSFIYVLIALSAEGTTRLSTVQIFKNPPRRRARSIQYQTA